MFVFTRFLANSNLWDRIASWYERSVLHELLVYLDEQVFSVRFGVYQNLSVGASSGMQARNWILSLTLGFILASGIVLYTRSVPGGMVRKMLKEGITSEQSAKTLYELGYFRSVFIRWDLAHGGALRKLVRFVGEGSQPVKGSDSSVSEASGTSSESITVGKAKHDPSAGSEDSADSAISPARKLDFLTDRFYIPDDLRYRAEFRYRSAGSGVLPFLISILLALGIAVLACKYLPALLTLADGLLGLV